MSWRVLRQVMRTISSVSVCDSQLNQPHENYKDESKRFKETNKENRKGNYHYYYVEKRQV